MRLMRCSYHIVHVPGKNRTTADAQSAALPKSPERPEATQ